MISICDGKLHFLKELEHENWSFVGAFYQIFFKALKVEKLTLFFSLISVNFVGSCVVIGTCACHSG